MKDDFILPWEKDLEKDIKKIEGKSSYSSNIKPSNAEQRATKFLTNTDKHTKRFSNASLDDMGEEELNMNKLPQNTETLDI